jgi:ADP-heptose:LPS heptosyltransferase
MGDVLRVLPAWKNLLQAFPDAKFQAAIESRHAFLLEPFPEIEPIIVHRDRLSNPVTAMMELFRVGRLVQGADASLDFHGILKSALIPYLGGVKARWGDGNAKEGAAWLQNNKLPYKKKNRYLQALGLSEAFGTKHGIPNLGLFRPVLKGAYLPPSDAWPDRNKVKGAECPTCAASHDSPTTLEGDAKPRILLVPGTSRSGAGKRWPLQKWILLANKLKPSADLRWVLGPDEEAMRNRLQEKSGIEALPRLPFWELASVVKTASRVLVGDTGLLHLSVLLGVKVTALMGPSDPLISGIPQGMGTIVRANVECSPCREKKCLRLCCLWQLQVSQVLATL